MKTKESVDVGLAVAVSEAFDVEHECEHPGHGKSVLGTHAGPGEWYANIHCQNCNSKRVYVMCDPFKRHVQATDGMFWCAVCYADMPASKLVVGFTKIGWGL